MNETEQPGLGRRELKKADKLARITRAADELFAKRPYQDVTTTELADAAGVTTGTFFRYAGSKVELFLNYMVRKISEPRPFDPAVDGEPSPANVADRLFRRVEPHAIIMETLPDNMMILQRLVLFGEHNELMRSKALQFIQDVESDFVTALSEHFAEHRDQISDETIAQTARSLYSRLYMDFIKISVGAEPGHEIRARFHESIDFVLEPIFAAIGEK